METTWSGRYLNTQGSGRTVSDFALVHSNEGDFRQSQVIINGKVQFIPRLANGGHGQKCLDLLDKYGIKYNILKTYSNGVRVGNVPNHYREKNKMEAINHGFLKIGRNVTFVVLENMYLV